MLKNKFSDCKMSMCRMFIYWTIFHLEISAPAGEISNGNAWVYDVNIVFICACHMWKKWWAVFQCGDFEIQDNEWSGKIDSVYDWLLPDRWISVIKLTEAWEISRKHDVYVCVRARVWIAGCSAPISQVGQFSLVNLESLQDNSQID